MVQPAVERRINFCRTNSSAVGQEKLSNFRRKSNLVCLKRFQNHIKVARKGYE